MLTAAQLSFLRSLKQKKHRQAHQLFVAEGDKLVSEMLESSFVVSVLCATQEWLQKNKKISAKALSCMEVGDNELLKISSLVTPQEVLAVVEIPPSTFNIKDCFNDYTLLLDGIRDPGNLGAIIRIADWFGMARMVCSPDCAEIWNPKVVQASMGSLLRVQIHTADLALFLKNLKGLNGTSPPVCGTFLEGDNLYQTNFGASGLIIIGNEGEGIRPGTQVFVDHKVTIPRGKKGKDGPESLNVAIATALVCAELRRGSIGKEFYLANRSPE